MTLPLPQLLDCRALQEELGVKRGAAEAIMRDLEKVRVGRRVFVRRPDVHRFLEENTVGPDGLRRSAA